MSAVATIAARPVGVVGVVALDRDRDPLRQVPAPGEDAADQGVVDAELLAFVAQALLGGAGDGVEVDLVAGVQAGDDEAADVVQEGGDRELVAFGPADRAADLVGGVLGGEGVDAEALRPQLPAAVGLEEVEDWARCRRSRARRRASAPRPPPGRWRRRRHAAAAVGGAQDGDRQARRRTRPLRPARRSRAVSAVAAAITRSRDSISDREALDRLEGVGQARCPARGAREPAFRRSRGRLVALTLPLVCAGGARRLALHIGSRGRSV